MSETLNKNEIKSFYYLINFMVNKNVFLLDYTVLTWNTMYHLTTKYNSNNSVNSIKFIEAL